MVMSSGKTGRWVRERKMSAQIRSRTFHSPKQHISILKRFKLCKALQPILNKGLDCLSKIASAKQNRNSNDTFL